MISAIGFHQGIYNVNNNENQILIQICQDLNKEKEDNNLDKVIHWILKEANLK